MMPGMGREVRGRGFTRPDRGQDREKGLRGLEVFARVLAAARFADDPSSVGLEVELNLTDERGRPAMLNAEVLERIADADFQTELAQFNVEINVAPRRLGGGALGELEEAVRATLNRGEEQARTV